MAMAISTAQAADYEKVDTADERLTPRVASPVATERMDIEVGDEAPDFTLPGTSGDFTLSGHAGETVVLYFYPGDDTPVCTKQAKAFRDVIDDFSAANAGVYGVSQDSLESHEDFIKKHDLPMPLLVDTGGRVREMYGQPGGGDEVQGRITYIIDGKGVVRHIIYEEEDMGGHVTEALEVVQEMAEQS